MSELRELRSKAGLTQAELARRSGVAQPNIAAYETGRRRATTATQARLVAALRPRAGITLREHRDSVISILKDHKLLAPRVFGSIAEGRDTPDSDVDLLVDAAPDLDLLDLVDAANELESVLGLRVDIVTSRSLRIGHEILTTAVAL